MITQIAQIARVEALLAKLQTTRFNALLPVTIEVRQKEGPQNYLLKIGTKEISTKTLLDLDVGSRYWGVMKEDRTTGVLNLSRLLKQPSLLKKAAFLPRFEAPQLMEFLSKEHPKAEMKTLLLHQLAQSGSKSEFLTLTNMIAALNENLFTMVLQNEGQKTIVQFRKRRTGGKKGAKEEASLEFYAAFVHLGPVKGLIESSEGNRKLTLYLYYENAMKLLEKELENLGFEGKILHSKTPIEPLYMPAPSLLDLKG
ncbi:MAG: hypothetical protein B6D59_03375 [Campylobacteraceae bacterium 4484_4]|nr:MAG: hypothetical protein B6D59_03375 [Campylobacteraceae bacterium 4484_4]